MELRPELRETLLQIATCVIRQKLGDKKAGIPLFDDPHLTTPAGCFVTLHRSFDHALRGCIGLLEGGAALREVLIGAAEGVLQDPRFMNDPITLEELPELDIEITILGPMKIASSPTDFEPMEQGIHLTVGVRAGLFLPQVARETRWTREQLLSQLCAEKMALPPNAWKRDDAVLRTFTTEIIGPHSMRSITCPS